MWSIFVGLYNFGWKVLPCIISTKRKLRAILKKDYGDGILVFLSFCGEEAAPKEQKTCRFVGDSYFKFLDM